MTVYKVTKIVRALWLAERSVCMRVCKHGCRVKIFCCFARYITQARFWKSFRVQNLTSFACGSWFHFSFGHFMTSFLWSIRVQIMENCGRFVNYISCNFFCLSTVMVEINWCLFVEFRNPNNLTWGDMCTVAELKSQTSTYPVISRIQITTSFFRRTSTMFFSVSSCTQTSSWSEWFPAR